MFPLYRNQSVRFTDLMNPFHGSSLLLNSSCRLQKTSGFLPDENDPAFAGILFFLLQIFTSTDLSIIHLVLIALVKSYSIFKK